MQFNESTERDSLFKSSLNYRVAIDHVVASKSSSSTRGESFSPKKRFLIIPSPIVAIMRLLCNANLLGGAINTEVIHRNWFRIPLDLGILSKLAMRFDIFIQFTHYCD